MIASLCKKPLDVWSLGMLGTCIDAPAAIRFGNSSFKSFVFEFHRTNPELRDDYWDSSGMTFYYTPNLRPHDAGMLITGEMHLLLPPMQEKITVESQCSSRCTKNSISEPIKLISGWHHMHYLGRAGFVDLYQNGEKRVLIDKPYFSYDSPKTFTYKPHIEVNPGDVLKTTCVYNTMARKENTYWGDDTFSEMCFSFLTYYPAKEEQSFAACVTIGRGDCLSYEDTKCDFTKLHETKQEFIDGLYEYCDPTGLECSKCCLLYLTSTLKGDPCWYGMMRETSQFLITDQWKDRNVTNMLLTCEHLHNLDQLLSDPNKKDYPNEEVKSSGSTKITQFPFFISLILLGWSVMTQR